MRSQRRKLPSPPVTSPGVSYQLCLFTPSSNYRDAGTLHSTRGSRPDLRMWTGEQRSSPLDSTVLYCVRKLCRTVFVRGNINSLFKIRNGVSSLYGAFACGVRHVSTLPRVYNIISLYPMSWPPNCSTVSNTTALSSITTWIADIRFLRV